MIRIRHASPGDLGAIAALAAPLQQDPTRYQAYFGDDADEIEAEIAELDDWADVTVVATAGAGPGDAHHSAATDGAASIVGWLFAEYDDEIGRVWWWGPVVAADHDWHEVAAQLLDAASTRLGDRFDQFEFAVDARHTDGCAFAERRGFRRDTGSVLLTRALAGHDELGDAGGASAVDRSTVGIGSLTNAQAAAVVDLHERTFPDTHLTGLQLVESAADDVVLVATVEGAVAGYLRAEIQPGGDGYIDFLGVDDNHRGHGIGGLLVQRALADLAERGASDVSLTVREDNAPARALYARLGFDGSRILVPLRLGFEP